MRVQESPNTPFTILYERFSEGNYNGHEFLLLYMAYHMFSVLFISAPDVAIYDNGCNLHAYVLNREPAYFKKTWFLVDRFHWRNHTGKRPIAIAFLLLKVCHVLDVSLTGCSIGYEMNRYPQFQSINSQVVEKANSIIQKIKGPLAYMNAENFMIHLKLFLWYRNREIAKECAEN